MPEHLNLPEDFKGIAFYIDEKGNPQVFIPEKLSNVELLGLLTYAKEYLRQLTEELVEESIADAANKAEDERISKNTAG